MGRLGRRKFNRALGTATSGLGKLDIGASTLGGGLTKFGQSLTSINLSPMSGSAVGQYSGIWGAIGRMVGGISPTSPLWAANTTLGSFLTRGFDVGGYTGNINEKAVAGVVHGGEYVFSKAAVEKIGLPNLDAMHKSARGYASGGYVGSMPPAASNDNSTTQQTGKPGVISIHIDGANGDDHVRALVQQGVQQGLSTYNENQRRGGVGSLQARYANQKG